ncbi:MAG: hypothetical protein WCR02_05665 [Sphaerochaetaceae bacterium]
MSCCLFIPTYWSTETLQSWKIFDHPSPITEDGTLGRTLKNLQDIGFSDQIVVLPIPCSLDITQKVQEICKKTSLPLSVITNDEYTKLSDILKETGFSGTDFSLIDYNTYGGARNIGLVYAAMHGFDQIIMIDDDECIDADYKIKALAHIGEKCQGRLVLGKTGCVKDAQGNKVYDGQKGPWGNNWPKDELFNQQIKQYLDAPENLMRCSLGFGGNMVIDRRLFTQVPFDPGVTRGEDDDYLLNCRYCDYDFFFDKDLLLLHLPPERSNTFWSRQRQDILRFLYTREKIKALGTPQENIGMFLRYFTGEDLEKKAVYSSIEAALHFVQTNEKEFKEFLENAKTVVAYDHAALAEKAESFKRMIPSWQHSMAMLWK